MMTFQTENSSNCGIVELDDSGTVRKFYEKVASAPGNLANGAVYLLDPEVIDWMAQNPLLGDFSTEVLPRFIGRIATWENTLIHRDIGSIKSLLEAQQDPAPDLCWTEIDDWTKDFLDNPIHSRLNEISGN